LERDEKARKRRRERKKRHRLFADYKQVGLVKVAWGRVGYGFAETRLKGKRILRGG